MCTAMHILRLLLLLLIAPLFTRSFAQPCVDSRKRAGKCVSLASCPNIIEEFYDQARLTSSDGIDFQTFISDSMCGFDGSNFLICCTNQRPARLQQSASFIMPTDPAPVTPPPPALSYLPGYFQFAPLNSAAPQDTYATPMPPPVQYPSQPQYPPMQYPGGTSAGSQTPPVIFQPIDPPVIAPVPSAATATTTTVVYQPVPATNAPPFIQPPPPAANTGSATCGTSSSTTNRVVGGSEAKRGTYPWIAALGYMDEYSGGTAVKFLCAGSLVSQRHVLTSAHCINGQLLLVRLGAHDLTNPAEPEAIDLRIRRSVQHESFNLQSIANDIAVIEMIMAVPTNTYIRPICLPEGNNFLVQDFVGMNPFIAGWGAVKHQGPTSSVLRDVQVPIVSRAVCEQSYRSVFKFVEFSDRLICAGNSNVDACQGDSGGPLMMPQMDSSGTYRYYLLGLVSYGYECARTGFPGVYTRVASFMPWIRAQLV